MIFYEEALRGNIISISRYAEGPMPCDEDYKQKVMHGCLQFGENIWKGRSLFEFWNSEENFGKFTITTQKKIKWNEDIEMDPDAFYLKLIGKTFEEYANDKKFLRHSN